MPVVGFQSKRYASHFFGKRNMFFHSLSAIIKCFLTNSMGCSLVRWAKVRVDGESWEEQGRGEKSLAEERRDGTTLTVDRKELQKLRRAEMAWEELRIAGHNWKEMGQHNDKLREQSCSCKVVRFRVISYSYISYSLFTHSNLRICTYLLYVNMYACPTLKYSISVYM